MTVPTLLHVSINSEDPELDPARFEPLDDGSGYDGVWFTNRLRELGLLDRLDFVSIDVYRGESLPDPGVADAVFVGGSYPSINDGFAWQKTAMDWLAEYRETGRPLLGICGGHQMVSVMRGGRVEPNAHGMVHGSYQAAVTEAGRDHYLFAGYGVAPEFHFGHYDHVVEIPPETTVLATTEWYEAGALDHGGGWVTAQFHPEVTIDIMMADDYETNPQAIERFRPLPDAPRMLANFLRGSGIID